MKKIREALSQVAHTAEAYPGFNSIKWLGIFLLAPGWMLVHCKVPLQQYFTSTHLYTVGVKCLAN